MNVNIIIRFLFQGNEVLNLHTCTVACVIMFRVDLQTIGCATDVCILSLSLVLTLMPLWFSVQNGLINLSKIF